jgi:hypothetical protein
VIGAIELLARQRTDADTNPFPMWLKARFAQSAILIHCGRSGSAAPTLATASKWYAL